MNPWIIALREGAVAGTLASLLSTAVLATAGLRQAGSAVAPTNAVSHWLWGDESLHAQRPTLRHTLTGYVTHHLASVFWAALYSLLYGHREGAKTLPQAVAGGVATFPSRLGTLPIRDQWPMPTLERILVPAAGTMFRWQAPKPNRNDSACRFAH